MSAGKQPGRDIFFVGVNWKKEALLKITDNSMLASGGGHFTLGGWTLVLLHDYHRGRDFSDEGLQLRMNIFELLDRTNVESYLSRYGDENWGQIDFTSYSKVFNPDINRYDFRLPSFLTIVD